MRKEATHFLVLEFRPQQDIALEPRTGSFSKGLKKSLRGIGDMCVCVGGAGGRAEGHKLWEDRGINF